MRTHLTILMSSGEIKKAISGLDLKGNPILTLHEAV